MNEPENASTEPKKTYSDFVDSVKIKKLEGSGGVTGTLFIHSDGFGCLHIDDNDEPRPSSADKDALDGDISP